MVGEVLPENIKLWAALQYSL